jgi:hypothetical protein
MLKCQCIAQNVKKRRAKLYSQHESMEKVAKMEKQKWFLIPKTARINHKTV